MPPSAHRKRRPSAATTATNKRRRRVSSSCSSASESSDVSSWVSPLPGDLVCLIGWRALASDPRDYVRLRAVCREWRSATVSPRGRGLHDPRFHPRRWMMLPEGHGIHPGHRKHTPTNGIELQIFQIDLPGPGEKEDFDRILCYLPAPKLIATCLAGKPWRPFYYLAECESEILVIGRCLTDSLDVEVYRLSDIIQDRIVPVTSIGGNALFVEERVLSVSSGVHPTIVGDCCASPPQGVLSWALPTCHWDMVANSGWVCQRWCTEPL